MNDRKQISTKLFKSEIGEEEWDKTRGWAGSITVLSLGDEIKKTQMKNRKKKILELE